MNSKNHQKNTEKSVKNSIFLVLTKFLNNGLNII